MRSFSLLPRFGRLLHILACTPLLLFACESGSASGIDEKSEDDEPSTPKDSKDDESSSDQDKDDEDDENDDPSSTSENDEDDESSSTSDSKDSENDDESTEDSKDSETESTSPDDDSTTEEDDPDDETSSSDDDETTTPDDETTTPDDNACDGIEATSGVGKGSILKDFSYPDQDGNIQTLHAHCEKGVAMVMSTEWCGPCQQEAKELQGYYEKYGADGLEVITLLVQDSGGSPADSATAGRWVQKFSLSYIVVAAKEGEVSSYWSPVQGYPSTKLMKPGIVVEHDDIFPITESAIQDILP